MRLHRISARHISAAVALSVGGFLGAGVERFRSRAQNDGSEEPINGEESILQYLPLPSVHAKSIPVSDVPAVLPDQSIAVKPQTGVSTVGDVMKYGFPSLDNIRSFDDYVLAYDKRTRTAHWVFEHITKDKISYSEGIDRTKSKFLPDGSIHEYFRGTNEDYKGSGYDRGHLAAAGNHKWSQQALDQTFFLSNISPQVGTGFNRDSWNSLEKFVRHLVKKYPNVYVCTGPLYLPRKEDDGKLYVKYEVIGRNHVAVPTHFFKVVVCETDTGKKELLTFVMPNKILPNDVDLKNYMVPLDTVERAAGLLIFDKIPKKAFSKINGKSTSFFG